MPLAVFNICRSEALGRRLLREGVQHVVCWPAEVYDREAMEFGIALVRCLLEDNIASGVQASLGLILRDTRTYAIQSVAEAGQDPSRPFGA